MNISQHSTRRLKLHNSLFIVLFLTIMGLLAFLSNRYIYLADWTVNNQNSLNEISLKLLQTLDGPIEIVSYTNNNQIKQSVRELIKRYQRIKPDISLSFIDPDSDPEKIRGLNISVDGEMLLHYEGRKENLTQLSEQDVSNTLHRLLRAQQRKILFITGHGERASEGQANFDLGNFTRHLNKQGFLLESINLAANLSKTQVVPKDTSVLVIAGPQTALLPAEVDQIITYINSGGNLLWLGEPLNVSSNHAMHGLKPLAERLGIEFLDGVVVDPGTQNYDISRPDYAIVTEYPQHPINEGFSSITLFPQAAGIERLSTFFEEQVTEKEPNEALPSQDFNMTAFLVTIEQSWIETSAIRDSVHFSDLLDISGPITIGMALERQLTDKQQRIVVMGDGDFLSNTFLGNAANLTMGLNIINWLSHDEQFINIPTRIKDDILLDISAQKLSLLGSFFLLGIPSLLALSGTLIWFKRRNS